MRTVIFRIKPLSNGQATKVFKHDLRLYTTDLPSHIHPDIDKNIEVWCGPELYNILNSNESNTEKLNKVRDFIKKLEQEQREEFKKMKEAGIVGKNQGYKLTNPVIEGVITLGRELRAELEQEGKINEFIKNSHIFVKSLSALFGAELIYYVVHHDETTVNIHFAMKNLRTHPPAFTSLIPLTDEQKERIKKGIGKSISNTFKMNTMRPYLTDYQFTFSELQDFVFNYFNSLYPPLERVRKEERIKRGEPIVNWKAVDPHKLTFYKKDNEKKNPP